MKTMPNIIATLMNMTDEELFRMALLSALYDYVWDHGEVMVEEAFESVKDEMPRDLFDSAVETLVTKQVIKRDGETLSRGLCMNCGEECWRPEDGMN